MCTFPAASPATIVLLSDDTAQAVELASAMNDASSCPLCMSHTRSVLSRDAETARRNGDPIHPISVAFERTHGLAALQLPHPQRVVPGCRDRTASIRRDSDPIHPISVAFERTDSLAALQVPHPQRLVRGRRDRTLTIRRDSNPVYRITVAFERTDGLAALQVPHPQRVVPGVNLEIDCE